MHEMSGECRVNVVCVEDQGSDNTTITAASTTTDRTAFATGATISAATTTITACTATTSTEDGGSSDAPIASVCVCLVCDKPVKQAPSSHLQQLLHGSGSSASHPLQPPLTPLLEEAIKTPLQELETESHRLCRRCFRLLEELDGLKQRSEVIKNSLSTWYNKSLLRRLNLQTAEDVILKSLKPESGSSATNTQIQNVAEPSISLKEEAASDEEMENVFEFEEEEEEELRPEDQGIRPDDPEFNPAYDNAWLVGWGSRGRGRGRGRARGRGRGRGRGRRKGRGRGPGRPPKNAKDLLPEAMVGESFGEKLGELVTKMLEGEEEEEEENEQVSSRRDVQEVKNEQGEGEDVLEDSEASPSKALQVSRPRGPGKRVPVLSEKMRLSLAEISKRSRTATPDNSGTARRITPPEEEEEEEEGKSQPKRQYRKRPRIIHLCKFCMKVCPTGEQLKEHQRSHRTIECQFCGKVLARIGAWENHLRDFHNVEIQVPGSEDALGRPREDVTCRECGKHFSSKSALAYHTKLHSGNAYVCDHCGKVFNHPSNLRTHRLRHEAKSHACPKCGKCFHTNFALLMHDNQTHRLARSWRCNLCSKAFTRCAAFREHVRIHTGEKPFECSTCGVRFRKIHHLKAHARQHGPRSGRSGPLRCPLCPDALFLHRLSYERHRKYKHPEMTRGVPLLASPSPNKPDTDSGLQRQYVLAEGRGDTTANEGYLVGVEGIQMVQVDDGGMGLGGQGGQCIIVLSEADTDVRTGESSLHHSITTPSTTTTTTPTPTTTTTSTTTMELLLKQEVEEDEYRDRISEHFPSTELVSVPEHIQLEGSITPSHLQQLSVAGLESGQFQVELDGETFDVYTVPSE